MTLNRTELVQRMLAHRAVAEDCERALKGEAERIFAEHRTADTWRMPGTGQVVVSLTRDRAAVVDEAAFLAWLGRRYPTEVVWVPKVRNPEWLKQLLGRLAAVDPEELAPGEATMCADDEGTVIPGVEWRKGGCFYGAAVRPETALSRRLAKAAEAYVLDGTPMPGMIEGPPNHQPVSGTDSGEEADRG